MTIRTLTALAVLTLAGSAFATGLKPPKHPEQPAPAPEPTLVLPVDRCAADSWSIRCRDKQMHLGANVVIGLIVADAAKDRPYWQRFAIGMAPFTAKELVDGMPGGSGFSWKDMTYNALGVAVGLQLGGVFVQRQGNTTVVGIAREF